MVPDIGSLAAAIASYRSAGRAMASWPSRATGDGDDSGVVFVVSRWVVVGSPLRAGLAALPTPGGDRVASCGKARGLANLIPVSRTSPSSNSLPFLPDRAFPSTRIGAQLAAALVIASMWRLVPAAEHGRARGQCLSRRATAASDEQGRSARLELGFWPPE